MRVEGDKRRHPAPEKMARGNDGEDQTELPGLEGAAGGERPNRGELQVLVCCRDNNLYNLGFRIGSVN